MTRTIPRVGGEKHLELNEVRDIWSQMNKKIRKSHSDKPDFDTEFIRLREVTGNDKILSDACEVCESVYKILEETDKAYCTKEFSRSRKNGYPFFLDYI